MALKIVNAVINKSTYIMISDWMRLLNCFTSLLQNLFVIKLAHNFGECHKGIH